ncbi:hypothetical protein C4556_02725 [Candidatus Parcubacteria bacterium]|nr:MAG: hypothetical protein C4556_02725 [Candidatus Parcubacteria bacterium]
MTTTQNTLLAAVVGVATLSIATFALALHSAEHYSFFGDASYVTPGNASARAVNILSDATGAAFGGISYGVEAGTTFASLTTLSSDFRIEADDTCVGGSPRVSIGIDTDGDSDRDGSIFVYFGVDSAGAACTPGTWQNTGDFLEAGRLVDTSQLPSGTFYDPYASALTKYGSMGVTSISIVTDSSWASGDSEHAADIDNTLINSTLFTYEVPVPTEKDQCKKGGWQNYADDEGNSFKNQGQCVAFLMPAPKGGNGGDPLPN